MQLQSFCYCSSFDIEKGDICVIKVAIIGESKCEKSTLLKSLH
jgi:ABC-type oligopeptide transport system ATPase subunit